MALASLNFYSRALNMDTCVEVLLPEQRLQWPAAHPEKKYPVLYLLHGHCQDHTAWLKSSRIEWYLRNQDVIVVFPNGDRAFYVDGKYTHRYDTYLTEELPIILKNWLPISDKPEDTYIGGMSMGGYGALHAGITHPEAYHGVIAMAPALRPFDIESSDSMRKKGGPPVDDQDSENNSNAIFGSREAFEGSSYDLFQGLRALNDYAGHRPKFYQCCGADDFLRTQNEAFAALAKSLPNIDLTFEVSPGMHTWDFWDREIVTALKSFNLLPQDYVRQ